MQTMQDVRKDADNCRALGLDDHTEVEALLEIERAILAAVDPNVGMEGPEQLFDDDAMPSAEAVVDAIRVGAFARRVRQEIGPGAEGVRKRMVARSVRSLRLRADTDVAQLQKPYDEAAAPVVAALRFFPPHLYGDLDAVYALGDEAVMAHRAAAPALQRLDLIAVVVDVRAGFAGVDGPALYATIGDPDVLEQATQAFSGNKPERFLWLYSVEGVTPRLHTPDEAQAQIAACRAIVAKRENDAQAEKDQARDEHKARLKAERGLQELRPAPTKPKATTRR